MTISRPGIRPGCVYKPMLKREKVKTKEVKVWSEDAVSKLQRCFDWSDWTVFEDSAKDIDELTDTVCSYITFCEDIVIPKKYVKVYPNNKPWVTKSLKNALNRKQKAFLKGDETETKGSKERGQTAN